MIEKMLSPFLAYRLPYGKFLHQEWETLEFMRDAGIEWISISPMNTVNSVGDAYSDYPLIWKWDSVYDFRVLDAQMEDVLSHHPSARFLVTVDLNSPLWLSRRLSVDSFYEVSNCSLHKEWKQLTLGYLDAFLRYGESRWGSRIAGYVIACGRTLEWIESQNRKPSILKNLHFQDWCKQHGLPHLEVPLICDEAPHCHAYVYDPEKEVAEVQWNRYVNGLTADLVIEFITEARKRIRPEAKIGVFYSHIRNGGIFGHLDCERVLDTAPPDFVLGAACNRPAEIGGNSGYIGVTEMLRRRNINFLFECDRITSRANLKMSEFVTLSGGIWDGWKNEDEDVAGLKRELGMALTNRLSFWFFNIWGGMYRTPAVRKLIRRAADVWKTYAPLSTGSAAEILLVIDPDSCYQMHQYPEARKALFLENRISASGLPADTATWEDLVRMDLSSYRMIVFESLVVLTSEKENVLRKKVCTDGRTVVFLHEAGIIRGGIYAEENVEKLTGIGSREARAGVHVRKRKDWTMVYAFDADALTKEKLFQLAEEAKVHIYVRSAAFHASGELLSVHCAEGGERVIHLPFRARKITEIFDGRVVAENTDTFTDSFRSPGTNIYFFK